MANNQNELPNTFIVGAAKAGTTTLYDLLKQHPEIFFSFDKEPMFFSRDDYFSRGLDWYRNTYFRRSINFPIRGEASPHYLYWAEKVSPRIKMVFQDQPIKLIIILRNPIQRAYSWYWNMVNEGRENLSFYEALLAEDDRLKSNWDKLAEAGSMQYGYIKGGNYSNQIKCFLKDFPSDSIKILLLDDLMSSQEKTIAEVFSFLGVASTFAIKTRISNQSTKPRIDRLHKAIRTPSAIKNFLKPFFPPQLLFSVKTLLLKKNLEPFAYPEMEIAAYTYLKQRFSSEISELSLLIKRDLSKWLEP